MSEKISLDSSDPPYKISTNVYDYIKEHINEWVEEAIRIRNQYPK